MKLRHIPDTNSNKILVVVNFVQRLHSWPVAHSNSIYHSWPMAHSWSSCDPFMAHLRPIMAPAHSWPTWGTFMAQMGPFTAHSWLLIHSWPTQGRFKWPFIRPGQLGRKLGPGRTVHKLQTWTNYGQSLDQEKMLNTVSCSGWSMDEPWISTFSVGQILAKKWTKLSQNMSKQLKHLAFGLSMVHSGMAHSRPIQGPFKAYSRHAAHSMPTHGPFIVCWTLAGQIHAVFL